MNNELSCVARPVGKGTQWVPAAGRQDLVEGEPTMTGHFSSFVVRSGPSGSHSVTCYEPAPSARQGVLHLN